MGMTTGKKIARALALTALGTALTIIAIFFFLFFQLETP